MAKRVIGHSVELAHWVADRLPHFQFATPYAALGLYDDARQEVIAGAIYDDRRDKNIFMHVAAVGRHWLNRDFLREGFRYPFLYLGCDRVSGLVRSSNLEARRFDEHLGFVLEGVMRRAAPDGDDWLLYGMLREECRWLEVGRIKPAPNGSNQRPRKRTARQRHESISA